MECNLKPCGVSWQTNIVLQVPRHGVKYNIGLVIGLGEGELLCFIKFKHKHVVCVPLSDGKGVARLSMC